MNPAAKGPWGGLSREVRLLCACQVVLSFGMGLAFPFFAIYLNRVRGLSMTWVGAGLSLSILATAASQWLGGSLSDRYGRRTVMITSLWARAMTVFALAAGIRGKVPVTALIAVHVFSNFVSQFFDPAARGWIADYAPTALRHRAYGTLRIATYVGYALGPALGGLLADRSYFMVFGVSGVFCSLCALLAFGILRGGAPLSSEEGEEPFLLGGGIDRSFLILCLNYAVLSVVMAQLVVPLSLYATKTLGLRDSQIGVLLSLNALIIVVFQIPTVRFFSGVRLTQAISFGASLYAAGFAGVGFAQGLLGLAAGVLVISMGELLVPPAVQALAANMSPGTSRGRYLGMLGLWRQVGSAIGPFAGCAGLEFAVSRGIAGHWLIISLIALGSGAGFFALRGRLLPEEEGLVDSLL